MDKLKLELIRWIAEQKNREPLESMHERMTELAYEQQSDTLVIGYTPKGNDVSKSRFVSNIKQAEMGIKNGEFLTLSELDSQSEDW